LDEDGTHNSVFGYVESLETEQEYVRELNSLHAQLYANHEVIGIGGKFDRSTWNGRRSFAVTENVVASVCDTATAMIARNRPKPTFQTDGADWSTKQRAKKLEKFVLGLYQKHDIYALGVKVFRDATIFGTGFLKIFADDGDICVERVVPDDIVVDEREARDCMPRQMHQRRFVNREVLKALYPDHVEAIESTPSVYAGEQLAQSDQVAVLESWHLPSKPGAGDGRYACCIRNACLESKPYKFDYFPIIAFRWSEPIIGFYGQGLAELITGIQLRINRLNRFIDRCQDLIAVPRVFMDIAGKVPKAHLSNEIGQIIPTRGGAKSVQFYTPPAVAPETYQRLADLKRSAFELAGISQLSAQSKKPADLASGAALREYNDIESARFAIQAQGFEELHMQIAQRLVWVAKGLYKGKEAKVTFGTRKFVETIKWSEVDMEEDTFRIDIEAASIMSRTPAGRLDAAIEMYQYGAISNDEFRRLIGHPDLQREMDLETAAIEDIEATIEELLKGEYHPPEPLQNLELGIKRIQMAYLQARRDGAPEDILEGFRIWLSTAQQQLAGAAPPAPPPGAMPPGMPMDPAMAGMAPPGAPVPPPEMGGPMPMAPPGQGPV
jgi:hypothetical protein